MRNIYYLLLLIIFLSGCEMNQLARKINTLGMWKYSDVRTLDPIDTQIPDRDLIALYTRNDTQTIQIRLDFLDMGVVSEKDIYILIDTNPGGEKYVLTENSNLLTVDINWDYLIAFRASRNIILAKSDLSRIDVRDLFIIQDLEQDYIIFSFPRKLMPNVSPLTRIQIVVTPDGQSLVDDQISPINFYANPPTRAKVLFVFWNTFLSTTPAETLRSWAGAHSGPMSNRHGLNYLLEFANKTGYPIYLENLYRPNLLSRFEYLNETQWIESLVRREKIYLYDYDLFIKRFVEYKERNDINGENDYAKSNVNISQCFQIAFSTIDNGKFSESFLQCKKAIVSNVFNKNINPVLVGGDFQTSQLGEPAILDYFASYLTLHPWIQVLTSHDVIARYEFQNWRSDISLPNLCDDNIASADQLFCKFDPSSDHIFQEIFSAIQGLPDNQIAGLARDIYSTLSSFTSPEIVNLSKIYVGQIGHVLAAAKWADKPGSISSCETDLDFDGEAECVLANSNIYLSIEPSGAYIPFLFSIDENGSHQIIGPTWEFMPGISDPSTWNVSQSVSSDPGQIIGAFVDDNPGRENMHISVENNRIIILDDISSLQKSYTLMPNEIYIEISSQSTNKKTYQLPLVLDPWIRYTSKWGDKYQFQIIPQGIQWEIKSGLSVQILSSVPLAFYSFNEKRYALFKPEDPNFDYGRGHYLPFPMALIEIESQNDFSLTIKTNP